MPFLKRVNVCEPVVKMASTSIMRTIVSLFYRRYSDHFVWTVGCLRYCKCVPSSAFISILYMYELLILPHQVNKIVEKLPDSCLQTVESFQPALWLSSGAVKREKRMCMPGDIWMEVAVSSWHLGVCTTRMDQNLCDHELWPNSKKEREWHLPDYCQYTSLELADSDGNMLTRRKESDTYLATVSIHRWSWQIAMKIC